MANTYLDKTGLALVWEKLKNLLSGKVDVETGKGLSTNDYTSDEKTKLAGIEAGAQVNVLEGIQKNGVSVTPTNKIANITVPTSVSELTNDSGYITASTTLSGYGITDAYTKTETDSAIASATAGITGITFSVVDSLPSTGDAGTIYLVADTHSDSNDSYDEYIYVNSAFEKLGNTDIDLSGYQTTMTAITEAEINAICV